MNKKTSIIIAIMMLISISLAVFPTVEATDPPGNPQTVSGHIYDYDEELVPLDSGEDTLILSIPGREDAPGVLYDSPPYTSTYVVDFDALEDEVGTFHLVINGLSYTADETITIISPPPEGGYFIDLHIDAPDDNPPDKVTGLTVADAKDGKLNLAWSAATDDHGVDYYNIYRDSSFLTTTSATSYQDTGLTNGQSYSYQVSAVDTADQEGELSDSASGTPTKSESPSPPPSPPSPPPSPPATPPPADDDDGDDLVFNNPPTKPIVNGSTTGDADTNYTYTAVSTDPDGHNISYTFHWNDTTNDTTTDFVANNTAVNETHQWDVAGVYYMWVEAIDDFEGDNGSLSGKTYLTILIDVIYVKDIGYLIDNDGDDIYEEFYSNETESRSSTEYDETNDSYLINSDGAEGWEWIYEVPTDTLTEYTEEEAPAEPAAQPDNTIWYMLGLGMLIVILILLAIYYYLKKQQASKKKSKSKKKK